MRTILILSVTFTFLIPILGNSQQQTSTMSPEAEKMMQEWMKYATPGEQHKKLMALAGTYDVKGKSRMDSSSPFMDTTASCEKEATLEGRWLNEHCQGPGMGGMPPFEGMGLLGYNNYKSRYEMFWFDNMSTMGFILNGTADASGKIITLSGSYEDPLTKKMRKTRWVLTVQDANHQKLELYETDISGKEYLGVELNYTRKS
jgi:hypothetical protein